MKIVAHLKQRLIKERIDRNSILFLLVLIFRR